MKYLLFTVSTEDNSVVKKFIYNEALTTQEDVDEYIPEAIKLIKKNLRESGFTNKTKFILNKRVIDYKEITKDVDSYIFIDNTPPDANLNMTHIIRVNKAKEDFSYWCNPRNKYS